MIVARSPGRRLAGFVTSMLLPIVGGAVVAMTAVSLIAQPIWGDQSWLLYAAAQVLDGARIGSDVVEVNPPTIIWLSEMPVALSRMLGVLPQTAMKLCLGLLIVLSAAWCASLVRRTARAGSGTTALWLAAAILFATTGYPWAQVGQREHIMVLLVLPYLVTAAIRLDGASPATWKGLAAGVVALIGFSLKPQHLFIVAGIEILLAHRHGILRSLMRPEATGFAFAGLAYCAAVWIFTDYLTKVVPFAYEAYLEYSNAPLHTLIAPGRTTKIMALLALWMVVRRHLQYRALCTVFVIAAIGATAGYLVQQKGWQYQFLPAQAYFMILLGMITTDGFTQWAASLKQPPLQTGHACAAALTSSLLLGSFYYPVQSAKAATQAIDYRVAVQQAITAALSAGTTIVVLGPNYSSIFDFVLERRLKWGARSIGFWTLEAIFDAEATVDRASKDRKLAELADVVRWTRATAVEDFQHWQPSLVLVERCADRAISCGTSESMRAINILQWFVEDSAFKAVWANYRWCRKIGYYDVWFSKQNRNVCRSLSDLTVEEPAG
jgi:hypothetical protein